MKNKVVHFEIPADNLEKAQKFYGDVFGWTFKKFDDDYIMIIAAETDKDGRTSEVGAINGGLQKRGPRALAPTLVIGVEDIDNALAMVKGNGGTVAVNKDKVGDEGYYAQFNDPEGNRIGLFQYVSK